LLAVQTETGFRPAQEGELSTHIAKLPSGNSQEIIQLEQLSTLAARTLLPDDEVAETQIAEVKGIAAECLLIRRFDRPREAGAIVKRHFEEFNQILGHISEDKYTGKYADMADVLRRNPRCSLFDVDRLFRRILVSILLGNNDAHLKNFGALYFGSQLRLSPFFDVLATALYPEYSRTGMALELGAGTNPTSLAGIGQRHLTALANSFGLRNAPLREATHDLGRRIETALDAVREAPYGSRTLKDQLAGYMRKRWNGTFKPLISSTGRKS
jgi:serine/threonine-protein kinase HipA